MIKKYFIIANIILIAASVFFCVRAFYKIAEQKVSGTSFILKTDRKNEAPYKEKKIKPFSYYNIIVDRDFFKTSKNIGTDENLHEAYLDTLKQTGLNLKLWGTVTGPADNTCAIIEEAGSRQQNIFKIGDKIKDATLKRILKDRVVLIVNGQDEVLELEKNESGRKNSLKKKSISTFSRKISLKRSDVENAVKDINALMKQAKIRPHFKDGKADGMVLSGIKRRSIFSKMSLRNGDVIVGVDGNEIESVDDAMQLYSKLKSSSEVQVQLKRRGRLKEFNYSIK